MSFRVYVACEDGTANIRGIDMPIVKGVTRLTEGHPILENYRDLFKEVEAKAPRVEQATAAPGEERE